MREVSVHYKGTIETVKVEIESIKGKTGWYNVKGEELDGEYLTIDALIDFFKCEDDREEFGEEFREKMEAHQEEIMILANTSLSVGYPTPEDYFSFLYNFADVKDVLKNA